MKIKFWGIEFEIFDAGCKEKVRYNHEDTARRAAQSMNEKATTRRHLETYKCSSCRGWHIGGRS